MGISLVGYSLPSFFIGLVLLFFVILKLAAAALPVVRPAVREPGAVLPDDDPAVDRAGDPLRRVLHAAHAQPDARHPRRGLHPHRARQGPAGARSSSASTRLRAGLTPIVTAAGLDLAGLLGGAIITESIFSLPGPRVPGRSTPSSTPTCR